MRVDRRPTTSRLIKVLYFGTYSKGPGYPRNTNIIEGLRLNGCDVIECHYPLWRGVEEKGRRPSTLLSYTRIIPRLIKAYAILAWRFIKIKGYDCIVVGYTGHIDVFLAHLLNRRKRPIIFDAFLSLYDTMIHDRGWFREPSMASRLLRLLDREACRAADLVLLDTESHIDYFCREFDLPRNRFLRIFAGAEMGLLKEDNGERELNVGRDGFTLLYFGTFLPLHGVDVIMKAAKELEGKGISFILVGRGEGLEGAKTLSSTLGLREVTIVEEWVEAGELHRMIEDADAVLGIFGSTEKAKRVIPFKVFAAMALGKPIITADTPAARELLRDGYNALLIPPGDHKALARAILTLKGNGRLLHRLAIGAKKTYEENCTPVAIGRRLREKMEVLLQD